MNKRLNGKRELSFNEFKKIIGQTKKSEKNFLYLKLKGYSIFFAFS